jgi:hypothetical protein
LDLPTLAIHKKSHITAGSGEQVHLAFADVNAERWSGWQLNKLLPQLNKLPTSQSD